MHIKNILQHANIQKMFGTLLFDGRIKQQLLLLLQPYY